jgi:hypothetical protein
VKTRFSFRSTTARQRKRWGCIGKRASTPELNRFNRRSAKDAKFFKKTVVPSLNFKVFATCANFFLARFRIRELTREYGLTTKWSMILRSLTEHENADHRHAGMDGRHPGSPEASGNVHVNLGSSTPCWNDAKEGFCLN